MGSVPPPSGSPDWAPPLPPKARDRAQSAHNYLDTANYVEMAANVPLTAMGLYQTVEREPIHASPEPPEELYLTVERAMSSGARVMRSPSEDSGYGSPPLTVPSALTRRIRVISPALAQALSERAYSAEPLYAAIEETDVRALLKQAQESLNLSARNPNKPKIRIIHLAKEVKNPDQFLKDVEGNKDAVHEILLFIKQEDGTKYLSQSLDECLQSKTWRTFKKTLFELH